MSELLRQQKDGVLIAQFTHQKLYDDAIIAQIGSELVELADQADGKMLLDFQGVMFMSSSMIGRVVILNKKCKADDIDLRMCNVSPSIMEVFEVTRLDKVFTICHSVDDALAEFG
jgi:anti-sigma B factor antagonist